MLRIPITVRYGFAEDRPIELGLRDGQIPGTKLVPLSHLKGPVVVKAEEVCCQGVLDLNFPEILASFRELAIKHLANRGNIYYHGAFVRIEPAREIHFHIWNLIVYARQCLWAWRVLRQLNRLTKERKGGVFILNTPEGKPWLDRYRGIKFYWLTLYVLIAEL